ncbi:1,2-phenylacetyl-CoA epoxidase subunit PaaC [Nocardioides terrisoli]|uniref:1,2-phenylacetyl-CoA epoxidase subunit PaaC n=1 Tax=Nocardioides terrisoli TaxID=3388267 RepID=UPI00287B9EBE|nr:1,2-phenylacetyl-CoA epoxidase subunit PaaC [Nocardioides marmorisolisilvae]
MTDPDHDEYAAYASLAEAHDESRWAFGTGFSDPLAGVDVTLPTGVDGAALATYCLMLGDDALLMSQRLAEWLTHAPELEEEVALANIGLDLLGQARLLLARAGAADPTVVPPLPEGSPVPADDALAYFRDDHEFRCVRLVERHDRDFAECVVRIMVFSAWRLALLERLADSDDAVLAAIAAKGIHEVAYHRDYAARWVRTLALGTDESRARTEAALAVVWAFLPELFVSHPVEAAMSVAGVGVDPAAVEESVRRTLIHVLAASDLDVPEVPAVGPVSGRSGRDGVHTEDLSHTLAEMQSVARAHPSGRW